MLNSYTISPRILLFALFLFSFSTYSTPGFCWGLDGHGTVGILAIDRLQPIAREQLQEIMGSLSHESLVEACNWPDKVRTTEQWEWSYPLHYINIPRGNFQYQQSRDCPEQLCATEAIKRYASELADREASIKKRRQAFSWLCHLTGDLHQPLHAGFADDRGGNNFEVLFENEQTNLHSVWDSGLISRNAGSWHRLAPMIDALPDIQLNETWSPALVNSWTNESHQLARQQVYPPSPVTGDSYERQSWLLIQQQLNTAAVRLALVINSVLADPQPGK